MDDAEIRAQLKELGEKCGPLTATTRKIYIKKIEKLRAARGTPKSAPQKSFFEKTTPKTRSQPQLVVEDSSGDEEEDEPEPEPEIVFKKPKTVTENEDINLADPAGLSNEEIVKVLRFYGIRHGPVNPQTRKVYHKKIREAQGESTQSSSLLEFSTDDEPARSDYRQDRQAQKVLVRKSPKKSPKKKAVQEVYRPEPEVIEHFSSSDDDEPLPPMVDMGTSCLESSTLLETPEKTHSRTPLRERNTKPVVDYSESPLKQTTSKISPLATESTSNYVFDKAPIIRPRNVKRTPPRPVSSVKRRSDEEVLPAPQPSTHRSPPPPNRHASILTQATPQPPEKRQRTEKSRMPQPTEPVEDTFAIRFSQYLPFIALGGFCFIVGIYCFKAGITILPSVSDEVDVVDQTPMETTEVGASIKSKLVDLFNQVEYDTRSAVCDFTNIVTGPRDVSKLTSLASLNFGDEINKEITAEIMTNENVASYLKISEDGFVSLNEDAKIDLGFSCGGVKFLSENYFKIRVATVICVLSMIFSYFMNMVAAKKRKNQIEIQQVVREIIDCLQNHSARHGSTGISVERIRDQIIPMGDVTLGKLWPQAVNSIKRDSRLRTEQKVVNGEEGEYWAWIDQSIKAHDETTSRAAPLAECLKIRNMLAQKDFNREEHEEIKETLINWCNGINGVVDIDMVPSDGTVYIKCSSTEKAGEVYDRIRAYWYKRQLIQIKYVKLDVYHRRFKNSARKTAIIA